MTSDSDQLDYDMSNRAQLPRGIENIRPHLETMDNVPLLVSLFTDCVPATTKEMLKIMQVSVHRLGVGSTKGRCLRFRESIFLSSFHLEWVF